MSSPSSSSATAVLTTFASCRTFPGHRSRAKAAITSSATRNARAGASACSSLVTSAARSLHLSPAAAPHGLQNSQRDGSTLARNGRSWLWPQPAQAQTSARAVAVGRPQPLQMAPACRRTGP